MLYFTISNSERIPGKKRKFPRISEQWTSWMHTLHFLMAQVFCTAMALNSLYISLTLCGNGNQTFCRTSLSARLKDARLFKESGFPLCVLAYKACLFHLRNKIIVPSKEQNKPNSTIQSLVFLLMILASPLRKGVGWGI